MKLNEIRCYGVHVLKMVGLVGFAFLVSIVLLMLVAPRATIYALNERVSAQSHNGEIALLIHPSLRGAEELSGTMKEQAWVSNWLRQRYQVTEAVMRASVSAAYQVSQEVKVDPLLILSVIGIESGFNPFAKSPVGAQGLMQIMSKVHQDKFSSFGGPKAVLDPHVNIKVGSLILREYMDRTGSVEGGLKMYVGAAALPTDQGYGNKVLSEYAHLKKVARGKNISPLANERISQIEPIELPKKSVKS